jgi:tetratricopeptide (TPR) repeat protein
MFTQLLILAITTQNVAIEGHVRDARTHSALAFATVELDSVTLPLKQQNTDLDGRFRFDSVAEGRYMLHITKAGYHSSSLELDVPTTLFPINVELVQMQSTASASRAVVSIREYMIPKKARKEFDLARKQAARQDCSKAIAHFENGLRAFDQDASVHNDLGNCYRKLGLLDRAEDSFKRATALSDSVYVALNLAEVYTAKHRYEDAENVLSEAIRRQPNSGDAYYGTTDRASLRST